jgi:hypothetical protein
VPQAQQQQRREELRAPEADPWIGDDEEWLEELASTRGFFRAALTFTLVGIATWGLVVLAVYLLTGG